MDFRSFILILILFINSLNGLKNKYLNNIYTNANNKHKLNNKTISKINLDFNKLNFNLLNNYFYNISLNFKNNNLLLNSNKLNKKLGNFNQFVNHKNAFYTKSVFKSRKKTINKSFYLKRIMLNNNSSKCNDGTNAGYYIRWSRKNSKKWVIFLEGGWFCYSEFTCRQRWIQSRTLMTSAHWPENRLVEGILSFKKEDNSFYYNANHVFVPYCSSDGWAGNSYAKSSKDLNFLGSKIVENVVKDLLNKGLFKAKILFLAGSSAGASGVFINLDKIAELLKMYGSKVEVKGLADSGWFLDNEPFKASNLNNFLSTKLKKFCFDGQFCEPIESIKKGIKYWNGQIPIACKNAYLDEPWKCFFGHRIYQTLKTPLFVIQWLFDEAQMTVDNVANPISKDHWNYVYKMGIQMKNSLRNVTGLFSPSCVSHMILTKKNWNQVKINGITLSEAIYCWETKYNSKNTLNTLNTLNKKKYKNYQKALNKLVNRLHSNDLELLGPSSDLNLFYNYFKKNENSFLKLDYLNSKHKQDQKKIKVINLNRFNQSLLKNDFDFDSPKKKCLTRLFDECNLPQCNSYCPKLKNVFTGEEIHFFDLLKLYGFNIQTAYKTKQTIF